MIKEMAYSQALRCEDIATTSGQIAVDGNGDLVGRDDVRAQTIQALENVCRQIEAVGFEKRNIQSLTIFLQDIERDFAEFDEGFREFFQEAKPCRMTVQAKLFKPEFLVEMNVIANRNLDNTVV